MAENDINIYGAVRAMTEEGKSAYAEQVYDEDLNKFQSEINRSIDGFDQKLNVLAAGTKVTLSVAPSTVYKGVEQAIMLTGTMESSVPTSMKLMDGDTELKSSSSSPITHTLAVTLSENTKTYRVVGETLGLQFKASASVNARYPIYFGFGTTASGVAVDDNRYAATTSAAHTYTKTNGVGNSQYFYILVPTDISALSTFSMGGAPFVMNATTETINGVLYRVYKSGGVYNSNVKVTVQAS